MPTPYIPAKDADFANWSANFATLIAASPATYGLTSGDAATITAADAAFQTAYSTAINPATRTPVTVQAKDTARTSTQVTERAYGQTIANNAGVSPSDKIALGLNPRTNTPTPVPAPITYPLLSVASTVTNGLVIRYRDDLASPSVKSKPAGSTALQLNAQINVGGTISASVDLWPVAGIETKSPFVLATSPSDSGKIVSMAGRWLTRRGLMGPWGPTITNVVP